MKRIISLTACALCMAAFCLVFPARAATEAKGKTLEDVVFYMERGASARTVKGESGLRFTAVMPKSDYEALRRNAEYTSVEYGMLICPADYIGKYGALNEENVFGENAVYADTDAENKIRIMRFYSDEMIEKEGGVMCFNGAIVDILPQNYLRAFTGVGYVKAEGPSGTEYKFAYPQDNARSVVYVAQRAVAEEVLSSAQKEILGAYIGAAKDSPCKVKIARHFEENGGWRVETEIVSSFVGETVSAEGEYAGYERNEKCGAAKGIAYADDLGCLDLFYFDLSVTESVSQEYAIDLSADENRLDTSALFGEVQRVNGVSAQEKDGMTIISAQDLAAMNLQAGKTEWKIETDKRQYTASVYVYDKIIYTAEELSILNVNPYGHYLIGADLYLVEPLSVAEFGGVLDGGGHCLYNAVCADYRGIFKKVTAEGKIRNIVFKNLSAYESGSTAYAALSYDFSGRAENVFVESSNAQYLFYSPAADAALESVVAILPRGKSVVAKDKGAVLKNGYAYLGAGNQSGCAEENYFVVSDSLRSFAEIAASLPLSGVFATETVVKAYDTFLVTL